MEQGKPIDGAGEAVDLAVEQEEAAVELYSTYLARTENQGLKQLLRSLIGQEKEHTRRLQELKKAGNVERLFTAEGKLGIDGERYRGTSGPVSELSSAQFLSVVVEKEGVAAELYELMASRTTNRELALLFRRLGGEERKHQAMARNRFELESLGAGSQ